MATVLPTATRDPGTYSSLTIPAGALRGRTVQGSVTLAAADVADATLVLVMAILGNPAPDETGPWEELYGQTWVGGTLKHDGTPAPPVMEWGSNAVELDGIALLRYDITNNKRVRFGVDGVVL